jgi:signal peptidase I
LQNFPLTRIDASSGMLYSSATKFFSEGIVILNKTFRSMKNYMFFIFLFLFSCTEITYKEPQPKGKKSLTEMPTSFRGRYLIEEEGGNHNDTLLIGKSGYRTMGGAIDEGTLGDSIVLKNYKGYHFLSVNQKPEWALRVIKQEKNGDLLFMSMEDVEFKSFLIKLGKDIKIDSSQSAGEKLYQIDPTPKQLVGLIEKKYFGQVTRIKKIK